ncbi:MAG: GntR family transcriptional regulator [Pseudomonadota bacterium]
MNAFSMDTVRIDTTLAGPRYQQISKILQSAVLKGRWPVGSFLPGENDLAREFDVSVGTMRKAIQALEANGLVTRHPGRGTIVADRRSISGRLLNRFRKDGEAPSTTGYEIIEQSIVPADATDAERLGAKTGEDIVTVTRLITRGGGPKSCDFARLRRATLAEIFETGAADDANGELHDLQDRVMIGRCSDLIDMTEADDTLSNLMDIKFGEPLLRIERLWFDMAGRPIEFSIQHVLLGDAKYAAEHTATLVKW